MRSAALDVSERDFVKATELLGVKRRRIMVNEILPNLISPLMVETRSSPHVLDRDHRRALASSASARRLRPPTGA